MPSVTYHVVGPFDRDEDGMLGPARPWTRERRGGAGQGSQAAPPPVGAVAFKRTGDADRGEFQDGEVIAAFGAVDRDALQG